MTLKKIISTQVVLFNQKKLILMYSTVNINEIILEKHLIAPNYQKGQVEEILTQPLNNLLGRNNRIGVQVHYFMKIYVMFPLLSPLFWKCCF